MCFAGRSGAGRLGRLAHPEPVTLEDFAGLHEIGKIERLDPERVGAQLVGQGHIVYFVRRGEHDNSYRLERGLLANPAEHFKSVNAWHFQVQQNLSKKPIQNSILCVPS